MRTRPLLPLVPLFVLLAARAWGQPAPAEPRSAAPAAVEPAAPAQPVVTIKDNEPARAVATKSKDAAGKDTLSVDFPESDIRDILRNVADLFELNLVIPESLQGKASIKLRDVTWRQIFQSVLEPVGYTYVEDGNIIKIVSNESLLQEPVSTEVFIINYARAADLVPTLTALVDASKGGRIVVDARSNSLVITERPSRMNRIRPIIEQLDRATDQVMIESKFVEVTQGDIRNLGVNWASLANYHVGVGGDDQNHIGTYDRTSTQELTNGADSANKTASGTSGSQGNTSSSSNTVTATNGAVTATSSTQLATNLASGSTSSNDQTLNLLNSITGGITNDRTLSAVFSADQFGVVLSALSNLTTAKVVSNPTIVTLNNTEAFINIGQEYPIPKYTYNEQRGSFEVSGFEYKPIGIILKVTPQVNARGFIKLAVEPEVSSFTRSVPFGGATGTEIPIIDTKTARTQVSLKDGFTLGIGGLIDQTSTNGEDKIPVLGSIPVLAYLFKHKTKNETTHNLLIFLTAKTLPPEGAPPEAIFNSKQIRDMGLKKEDMPGYRDGSDPFGPAPTADAKPAKKKSHWFGSK
jgi:type IV pilus assembly protein PilQ